MCLDDIKLGLGSCVVTFLERTVPVHLTVCSLCIMSICNFGFSLFGFKGDTLGLIAPAPGHCLPFGFQYLFVLRT